MILKTHQQGQTLIETLVAAFVLVMGITAAVSLATYSLGITTNIKQRVVAIGLAREGVEVVKNMRDTNWLNDTLSSNCYDFLSDSQSGFCYQNWLSSVYEILPNGSGVSRVYTLEFNQGSGKPWSLVRDSNYKLDFDSDPFSHGIYYFPGSGNSNFSRKITIEQDNFEPFNHNDLGTRVKVTSQVWWTGKNCPVADDAVDGNPCMITLQTYLTNWRNF